jgi:hypothetical protein
MKTIPTSYRPSNRFLNPRATRNARFGVVTTLSRVHSAHSMPTADGFNWRSLALMVLITLAGVLVGLVVGYIPSLLVYGLVAGASQGTSQTGGWAEAGAVGGVVWLGLAGLVVGSLQQQALPRTARNFWWVLATAAIWAAAHVIEMMVRRLPGDVDLGALVPALVGVSLAAGVASLHTVASDRTTQP